MKALVLAMLAGVALVAPAHAADSEAGSGDGFGVLVMAHGGKPDWEAEVTTALAPLEGEQPFEIAFGMADAASLQAAVDKLEARGVDRIGVVRLFVSGESWYERTRQILGLEPGAPARPAEDPHAGHHGHGGHGMGHSMEFWRLDSDARFALSEDGLMDAPEMGQVLATRAETLSRDPAVEDVLVLAHGPADDAEDLRWKAQLDDRADAIRALGFRHVQVETLREDWPEKRKEAEARIRDYVAGAAADGGRAIVIPFRVQGFGPYAKVLDGLDYVSDGRGLVPHPAVAEWVRREAADLRAGLREAVADSP